MPTSSVPTQKGKRRSFYELVEVLRESLKKKVDLLDETQLDNNSVLVKEILRDGIKIYG